MTELSRFFDGGGYTEAQFAEFMHRIMYKDGVVQGILNELAPTESTPAAMTVAVNTGEAWLQGAWYQNTESKAMTIEAADPTNPRIDRVVLRLSWSANSVILAVLKGTAAASPSAPALTQSSATWEISLCQVAVAASATSIVNANITDQRATSACGYAACNIGAMYIDPDGDLNAASLQIHSVADPTADQDAATKKYLADNYAPIASPTFTGTPAAPTAATTTSTTQIATTAFVQQELGAWANWTPTLTWGGVTPSGAGAAVVAARYSKTGKTMRIQVYITWGASATTTSLDITNLPTTMVTTIDRVPMQAVGSYYDSGGHTYHPLTYLDTSDAKILCGITANTGESVVAAHIAIEGFYEVS